MPDSADLEHVLVSNVEAEPNRNFFPFDAVLWDMDGSLVDSEPIWIEEESNLMRELGVDWNQEDAEYCLGGPMARVDEYMRMRSGYRHEPLALAHSLIDRMVVRLTKSVNYTPGAELLIRELQQMQIPMALVTASNRRIVDAALSAIGAHFFHHTISSDDVMETKPDPEGYLLAAERIGVSIEKSLIIEDSRTGMAAAIASGAYVLGLPHFHDLPTGEKVIHCPSLEGLGARSLSELFRGILPS